jgi:hypothetical protein
MFVAVTVVEVCACVLNINMGLSMGHYNLETAEFANWIMQIGNGTVSMLPPQHDLEEDWI